MMKVNLQTTVYTITFAAGANYIDVFGKANNYNYQEHTQNGWPKTNERSKDKKDQWLHSDIKNVAYYYVHSFFEFMVKGTEAFK